MRALRINFGGGDMIELSNQRPYTEEEVHKIWPNCFVWLHSYEFNQDNPMLSRGVPYLVIEEKDLGTIKRKSSEFPQFKRKATISTFPVGPGLLSNYSLPGENYDKQS